MREDFPHQPIHQFSGVHCSSQNLFENRLFAALHGAGPGYAIEQIKHSRSSASGPAREEIAARWVPRGTAEIAALWGGEY